MSPSKSVPQSASEAVLEQRTTLTSPSPNPASKKLIEQLKKSITSEQIQSTAQYLQKESKLLEHVAILIAQQVTIVYQQHIAQSPEQPPKLIPTLEIISDPQARTLDIKSNFKQESMLAQIHLLLQNWFESKQVWVSTAEDLWSHLLEWEIRDLETSLGPKTIKQLSPASLKEKVLASLGDRPTLALSSRLQFLEGHYAEKISTDILQDLRLVDYPLSSLEKLLGINLNSATGTSNKRLKPNTSVSLSKVSTIAPIPTGLPIVSSISAQLHTELWKPDEQGIAHFRYNAKNNQNNFLEHFITSPGDIESLPWEAAEQIINKFGFNTVKLQMIFAAHAMRQSTPWESTFTLKASDIIEELGWNKNHNTNLPTKRNEVASIAHALSCLLVKSVWLEGRGKTQVDASTPIGRMWELLIDPHGQFDWTTGRIENPDEVFITVRPGLWTAHFLNQAGSKAKEALYQFGYLALNILKIDPYHDELALRLAIHLTLDVRIRARDRHPYEYKLRSLLSAILPENDIQEACQSSDKARNLFKRWNHASKLLASLGWHSVDDPDAITFYTRPYPEWMDPESKIKKPRGWIEQWLEQKLVICPPDPIPERMSSLSPSKTKIPKRIQAKDKRPLTGEEVKAARKTKGWTQAKLAGTVKVHQSLIAKVEAGKRTISDDLAATLRQVLDL
jgi:DNA-binding XRE family transcriptional regulator